LPPRLRKLNTVCARGRVLARRRSRTTNAQGSVDHASRVFDQNRRSLLTRSVSLTRVTPQSVVRSGAASIPAIDAAPQRGSPLGLRSPPSLSQRRPLCYCGYRAVPTRARLSGIRRINRHAGDTVASARPSRRTRHHAAQ
jgi:hypothetical protein